MANPFSGILINGNYFSYVPGSYKLAYQLKNFTRHTQNNKAVSILGNQFPTHTMTLHLSNIYPTYDPVTNAISTGTTLFLGTSQLASLVSLVGNNGTSFPLTLVIPDGSTHSVIPVGSIDASFFIPDAPNSTGVEYRVDLTFENIS